MKRTVLVVSVLLLLLIAFLARENSTGKRLIDTGKHYTGLLAAGETGSAYTFLSDSLSALLTPGILTDLDDNPSTGNIRTGRYEPRGFSLSVSLTDGGSRTLWLKEESDGNWKITGDTSLDNLLGNAIILCSSYARGTVIPAVSAGDDPGDYFCPVSGSPYFVEDGRLLCPVGHLGNGFDIEGSSCKVIRDSLAVVVSEYVSAGYQYPSSFREMFENSNGRYGRRGGFHCPDDGYSYYEITADGVYCPYHAETSSTCRVDIPDSTSADRTELEEN